MKRNWLIIGIIVLVAALIACIAAIIVLTQNTPALDPSDTTPQTTAPIDTDAGTKDPGTTLPVTDPITDNPETNPADTLPPVSPSDYEIPAAFRQYAVLDGNRVIMTVGGYRVTFPTTYKLVDVGGVPSLIAPDGSTAKVNYIEGAVDVDALAGDKNYVSEIIDDVLSPVASAELVSSSGLSVIPLYGTRVGTFRFSVALLGNKLNYQYYLFSDADRFYTITLVLLDGTTYNFGDVMASLEKVDSDTPITPPVTNPPVTDPPVTKPPVTNPPVTNPPVTDPPIDGPDDILPPDDLDPEGYEIPDAFRDSAVPEGDKVRLTFGAYRVVFPMTYKLVDLGGGMPGLVAPDGSTAAVWAVEGEGDVEEITADDATRMMQDAIRVHGGKNMIDPTEPMLMPLPGTTVWASMFLCSYEKDGKPHDLTYAVFYEDGMKYSIALYQLRDTPYTFMDVVGTVEKVG